MIEDDVCPHGKPDLFCFECYDSQPAETTLPGCMMPDGADPCRAYRQAIARAEAAERDNARLREALSNAPHALNCPAFMGASWLASRCNCWKRNALRAQPGEDSPPDER